MPLFVGVLDNLSISAVGAYSASRRLSGSYAGPLFKVMRAGDSAVLDIGYDNYNILNAAALLNFIGTDTGYIAKWYDQSGNANDAVQDTAANMPVIVNLGALVTKNSWPSFLSDSADRFMVVLTGAILGNTGATLSENYLNAVAELDGSVAHSIISNDRPTFYGHGIGNAANGAFYAMYNRSFFTAANNTYPFGQLAIVSANYSTTTGNQAWVNGTAVWSGANDTGNGGDPSGQVCLFDSRPGVAASGASKYITEIIVTNATAITTVDRQAIEHNQENFYGITGV